MSRNVKEKDQYKPSNPNRSYTLMSYEDLRTSKKSFWDELEITGGVTNISPGIWELNWLTCLYLNKNKLCRIPTDIARLQNLVRLDLSCNNLKDLPIEIGDIIPLRELNVSHNHIKALPFELGKLFNLQTLEIVGNPLSLDIINLHSQTNGTQKLISFLLNNLVVQPVETAEREWIPLQEPSTTRPSCVFTVLCYNVLCDKYASRTIYGYCPQWALEWNYRRKGISEEIMRFAADIITLQEVETDQFYNWFLPELGKIGYDGIFSPKSRAKHMNENERKYVDGCAIFWKIEKFTLVKEHLIEFNQLAMANHDGSQDMLNRVMTKDNIGLAALLHTTEQAWGVMPEKNQTRQSILVCTAHIHWDPEFCDVKLIQTIMLMSEIRVIVNHIMEETSRSRHHAKRDIGDVHLLLCGDLNSLPESGVVEFLTKGCVSMDHTDFKGLGYKASLQKLALSKSHNSGLANQSTNMYTHSFSLASAYDYNIMAYTNYTYDFKGIIDYIFHSCSTIKTLGVLGPIDPEWFKTNKVLGCPHPNIPSDHFPLMAELELTPSHVSHQNGLLNR